MKGKYRVVVSTKRLKYDFELHRNLTIIQGDSATGKTTMIDMIREFVNNPSGTPVELVCDKKCFVLEGALWKEQLSGISDSIVFIDEGNEFIKTTEFADEIQKTDNYYVIVTRESLPSLPYSVEEIYGIKTSGKYGTLKQSYHEFYQLYGANTYERNINPEIVITEDSNSGYQFFDNVCRENKLGCESMNGKSNVFHYLNKHKDEKILVINNLSGEKLIADITIPVEVVLKSDGKHIDTFKNLVNGDDVKVDVSLTNRTMHLRIAPYGVVWLKL